MKDINLLSEAEIIEELLFRRIQVEERPVVVYEGKLLDIKTALEKARRRDFIITAFAKDPFSN